jgi:HAD superfamily hydrolase (TIGR01509 family)
MTLTIPPGDFDAYIFDCDGTLIDSMPLHLDAWRAALEQHEFPPDRFTEKMHHEFAGMPGPAIVRELNELFGTTLPPEAVEAAKLEWYLANHHAIKPVQAVVDFAQALLGRKPMAVASGSDAEIVRQGLEAVGILDWFQTIVTPVDVARGKPAPDMFLLAAARLGVIPERCLVFEDGLLGIQAADAAGMAHVFVPTLP